jgi:hypothetical protein
MVETYPSYNNLMEVTKVERGSEEDPLKELEDVLMREGEETMFDVICPFFAVVLKKKEG